MERGDHTASMKCLVHDAVLLVSFGGPDKPEDILPFLDNVIRDRHVPRERVLEVAEQYQRLGGKSPINDQNRDLISSLENELRSHGYHLPVYWGNRNWHPLLPDTLQKMADDGVKRALAFVTSAYSSYSGCRQYLENIEQARAVVGVRAPKVDKLRAFFNAPGFVEANREQLRKALTQLSTEKRSRAPVLYTAHSVPSWMAESSDYEKQLLETARLVHEAAEGNPWKLVYQSRSGPSSVPWLGPDISEALKDLAHSGAHTVILAPIGFISDHMEVQYDLDIRAKEVARELGVILIRASTAGTHPAFVAGIRELIEERLVPIAERKVIGKIPPQPDNCPKSCCPPPKHVPLS